MYSLVRRMRGNSSKLSTPNQNIKTNHHFFHHYGRFIYRRYSLFLTFSRLFALTFWRENASLGTDVRGNTQNPSRCQFQQKVNFPSVKRPKLILNTELLWKAPPMSSFLATGRRKVAPTFVFFCTMSANYLSPPSEGNQQPSPRNSVKSRPTLAARLAPIGRSHPPPKAGEPNERTMKQEPVSAATKAPIKRLQPSSIAKNSIPLVRDNVYIPSDADELFFSATFVVNYNFPFIHTVLSQQNTRLCYRWTIFEHHFPIGMSIPLFSLAHNFETLPRSNTPELQLARPSQAVPYHHYPLQHLLPISRVG